MAHNLYLSATPWPPHKLSSMIHLIWCINRMQEALRVVVEDAGISNDIFPRGTDLPQTLNPSLVGQWRHIQDRATAGLASEEIRACCGVTGALASCNSSHRSLDS